MNKILVTGCGGMLGKALYPYFIGQGYNVLATDIDLNESWLKHLDVRDKQEAKKVIDSFNPDLILHLAALTSLEYCETHLEDAFKTNYLGTRNIAEICKVKDIPLVYISTAGVFNGKKHSYTEEDYPDPLNTYGTTKLLAEIVVPLILKKHFIVRAGWMVGGGKKDKKFVSYICKQIAEGRKKFTIVNDKFGTITYTKDFAKNLELLIRSRKYGLYHMACLGETDRVKVAKHIIKTFDVKNTKIKLVDSSFFAKDFPVTRAKSERMKNQNLEKKGLNIMRDWKEALSDYLLDEWKELGQK